MVNYPDVLSRQNTYLVSEARQNNSQFLKWCHFLSVICSHYSILYFYCIFHALLISSIVINILNSSLGLNNERRNTGSKDVVAPDLVWKPTTYKVMSYYKSCRPETHTPGRSVDANMFRQFKSRWRVTIIYSKQIRKIENRGKMHESKIIIYI